MIIHKRSKFIVNYIADRNGMIIYKTSNNKLYL